MKKNAIKRWFSILLAAAMLINGSAYDLSGVVKATAADYEAEGEIEEATVSESSTVYANEISEDDTIEDETAEDVIEEPQLIPDADKSSGVYYNAGSSMTDFRDETIYFIMTTRFYDGDPSNNVQCWDAQQLNANDPPWRGDFKGLIEKLDYIKALGFTAIWITPVVENASGYDYHGYHALNFSKVDPRYESSDCDYQDLIDAVHGKGMKIIQDVVFNHTGNWGEGTLLPIASKDYSADLSDCEATMKINYLYKWNEVAQLLEGGNYVDITPANQFQTRVKMLGDGTYDTEMIYHHDGGLSSWESYDEQVKNIAGDCIDLNTENPKVYHYLVDAYSQYIRMGVDAFRVDTVKHISRLTYNNALIAPLNEAYNEVHGTTGEGNFYMFGEVCTRVRDVWNHDMPCISCPFYTWKERADYAWDDSETLAAAATNRASVDKHFVDNRSLNNEPTSNNAKLNGNEYHTPDYSKASGLNVIDFPMHWNFQHARDAFGIAVSKDQYYNDATFNVTYVDSHDYAPDGAPENKRFSGTIGDWAENLSLMFTFRGIPCIYYGSEVEFQKGMEIDVGPNKPLAETGRAYFGDLIEGSVNVTDFGRYNGASGKMAESLNYPLSLHIQRLNRLRLCIPALRKGQYSTEGCSGGMSFKRRYTDADTDSFVLVAITENATFTGIPNGRYVDAITGSEVNVSGGTLSTSGIKGQGDLRVYVLDTGKAPYLGMIDGKSEFMSGGTDSVAAESPVPREQGGNESIPATGITLDKTSASLDIGGTTTFTATVLPAEATNKTVKWSSSNTAVATVSSKGVVTGMNEGTATITAKTGKNNLSAEATVTVTASGVRVEGVSVYPQAANVTVKETLQLTASVTPANADPKYAALTWKSDNTAVATVDQNGKVTGVKQGTAVITVQTAYFGKSATAVINVKGPKFTFLDGDAVYFEKPAGWRSTVKAYFWTDVPEWNNGWPGEEMQLLNEEAGIYGIKIPEGKSIEDLNVIFTDKIGDDGIQTGDLKAVVNGYYDSTGYIKTVDPNEGGDDPVIVGDVSVSFANEGETYTYDGTEKKPNVIVKAGDTVLTNGTDYIVRYMNNINAASENAQATAPTVIVTGIGNYAGKITGNLTFTITPKTLTDSDVSVTGTYTYSGNPVTPSVTVTSGGARLTKDTDYEIAYSNNINAGNAVITVRGLANYTGTVQKEFRIEKAEIPEGAPQSEMTAAVGTVASVYLGTGWEWSASDKNKPIEVGQTIYVTAEYTKEDRDNYNTIMVSVKITGVNCTHEDTSKHQTEGYIAATCTTEGFSGNKICTNCQTKFEDGISIAPLGHNWESSPRIDKAATCTVAGSRSVHCSRCDETKDKGIVPALGHTGGKATCSSQAICDRCGQPYGSFGNVHTWDAGTVTKAPTATADGIRTYTCIGCKETKTETIPKLGGGNGTGGNGTGGNGAGDGLKAGDSVTDTASNATYKVTDASGKTVEFISPAGALKTVKVPNEIVIKGTTYQVTSVANNAFKNNKTIQTVQMGSNVKVIGESAFSGCSKLKKVTLSSNTTTIGSKAFYKCTSLTSITIPSKVSKIGSKAFYGCKKLKKITIKTTKLTSKKVGSKAFKGIAAKATIKVPKNKLSTYKKLLKAKGVGSKAKIKK
ncbi:MAG: alpha-amylase family glycosyl hydrolase [Roseburia sp.]|nr:alpha-amylase family glycosyl hydrolase [Roseburia sp.]MCM1279123.1 alpha-amylase family glycosyl hydrolase [Robinsoniella sp.]